MPIRPQPRVYFHPCEAPIRRKAWTPQTVYTRGRLDALERSACKHSAHTGDINPRLFKLPGHMIRSNRKPKTLGHQSQENRKGQQQFPLEGPGAKASAGAAPLFDYVFDSKI